MVGDLGYQLTFSYFDEASVSEWKGCDLRLAHDLPNIDLVVLPIRKVERGFKISLSNVVDTVKHVLTVGFVRDTVEILRTQNVS